MFCTNCGKEIDDDSIYCDHCGHKIIIEDEIKGDITENYVKEEIIENENNDILKNMNISELSRTLCIILLIIGSIASLINVIGFYIAESDITYILGQTIFLLIFIISMILLWKSKKIGGFILILFVLFKMISSIYYYGTINEYVINNLIFDEIFYFVIMLSLIISWRNLK